MLGTSKLFEQTELPIKRPSEVAQKALWLDGAPLSLAGRNYLKPIYDFGYRNIILKCGRQVEKSSTLRHVMLTRSLFKSHYRSLYVSPSQSQTSDFAKELGKVIAGSPYVVNNFTSPALVNQTLERQFLNGSTIKLRSAFLHADRCRGISVMDLYIDEIQDFLMHNMPVIEECQSHYQDVSRRMYSGTPKSFNNPIEVVWQDSSMSEWMIKCSGCNNWNNLGVNNIGMHHLICAKCGKQINPIEGQWVSRRKHGLFKGFRISQLMVPFSAWDKILEKYERYSPAKFHNEVLGESFDSSDVPITEKDIVNACDPQMPMYWSKTRDIQSFPTFMGIDWGTSEEDKSRTVVTIGYYRTPNLFQYIYCKKFGEKEKDPLYQIEEIAKLFGRFKCDIVCADWGFGHVQNRILQDKLGPDKVVVVYYSHNQKKNVQWNQKGRMFVVNKPRLMSNMFSGVKLGTIRFFNWNELEQTGLPRDWLNIYTEYDERVRTMKYLHNPGFPDDAFHSSLYCKFGGSVHYGTHTME